MTRRQFVMLLAAAANEPSKEIIRRLYVQPQRGARDRAAKLAPAPPKTPKVRGKGAGVLTKKPRG